MNTQQKLEIAGNGSVEFFAQLQSLLANKTATVTVLPMRNNVGWILVRPFEGGMRA